MWIAFECYVTCVFQVSTLNYLVQITGVIVFNTQYSKAQAMGELFGQNLQKIRQRHKALAIKNQARAARPSVLARSARALKI